MIDEQLWKSLIHHLSLFINHCLNAFNKSFYQVRQRLFYAAQYLDILLVQGEQQFPGWGGRDCFRHFGCKLPHHGVCQHDAQRSGYDLNLADIPLYCILSGSALVCTGLHHRHCSSGVGPEGYDFDFVSEFFFQSLYDDAAYTPALPIYHRYSYHNCKYNPLTCQLTSRQAYLMTFMPINSLSASGTMTVPSFC